MKNSQQLKLLPNKTKKIGLSLLFIPIITLFFKSHIKWEFIPELMKLIILVALVIISLSKDKIEDEMKNFLRLNCFVFSLISCVVFYIIFEILNFIDLGMEISGTHILMQIFLTYIISYKTAKYKS